MESIFIGILMEPTAFPSTMFLSSYGVGCGLPRSNVRMWVLGQSRDSYLLVVGLMRRVNLVGGLSGNRPRKVPGIHVGYPAAEKVPDGRVGYSAAGRVP